MTEFIVDISQPPIPPPTRTMKDCWFGCYETDESIERTKRWKEYSILYTDALRERREQ